MGIARSSKYMYVELHPKVTRSIAGNFLKHLIQAVPYQVQIVLTAHGIAHRLTQVGHPWSHGQVARMKDLLKSATVKRYYYAIHQCLKKHLDSFVLAYNHGKRKPSRG